MDEFFTIGRVLLNVGGALTVSRESLAYYKLTVLTFFVSEVTCSVIGIDRRVPKSGHKSSANIFCELYLPVKQTQSIPIQAKNGREPTFKNPVAICAN